MGYTVLIFDNRAADSQLLAQVLRDKFGYHTITTDTTEYDIQWITSGHQHQPDLILIDIADNGTKIIQIIRQMKTYRPQLPIIIMTQYGSDDFAMSAIAAGANDFITKPVSIERLRLSIQNALKIQNLNNEISRLQRKNTGHLLLSDLIGQAESFKKTIRLAEKSSSSNLPVRIDGEQGTGRESLARAIHGSSSRVGKPFLVFNCQDINHGSAETLLFGKVESSDRFTIKAGMLQAADQGTLYFNEITCLPLPLQQRLLNVINDNEIKPIGAYLPIAVDVRVMCSNSRETGDALFKGLLHNGLHDKLCVMAIPLPSLRSRKEDIAALAQHFLNIYAASENRFPAKLSEDAIESLQNQPWLGNIRQMANLLHRAVLLSQLDQIDAATLRLVQQLEPVHYSVNKLSPSDTVTIFDRQGQVKKLRSIENEAIILALKYSNGCMTKAARNLGIGRSTLYRKIDEMGAYMPLENQTTRPIMPVSAR